MQPTEEQLEVQKQLIETEKVRFEAQVNEANATLKSTHDKKEFTFSTVEKRRLSQLQLMNQFVEDATQDIINMSVLPRLEIAPNPEVRVLYDITLGRFTIWQPKANDNPIRADQTTSSKG